MTVSTRFPTVFGAGWTNPSNMGADDNTDATAGPGKNGTTTSRVGTFGFDANIPAGATIDAVKLIFEYFVSTTASVAHFHSTPVVGGTTQTLREEQTEPTARTVFTIDHTADRAWTRADLLDGTLEWDVGAHRGNSNNAVTFNCDYVKCEVTYTTAQTFQASFTATAIGVAAMTEATTFRRSFAAIAVGVATLTESLVLHVSFAATAVGQAAMTTRVIFGATFAAVATGVASLATQLIEFVGGAVETMISSIHSRLRR